MLALEQMRTMDIMEKNNPFDTCQYFGEDVHPSDYKFNQKIPKCKNHVLVKGSVYCEEHYPLIYSQGPYVSPKERGRKSRIVDEATVVTKVTIDNHGELCYNEVVL